MKIGARQEAVGNSSRKTSVFSFTFCATLFALCVSIDAQQTKKISRIGYLSAYDAESESTRAAGIRLALRELGYIEGQNIAIEYRYANAKRDRYPELVAELLRLKVNVMVVAGGVIPIQVAQSATKSVPIVMAGVGGDPVKLGLVESLARPGGNVTGITNLQTDLDGKRLELLKESVAKLARVAVLYDPAVPVARQLKNELPAEARALGLNIRLWEIEAAEDLERVFAVLRNERPDAVYASSALVITLNRRRIVDFTLKSRLPSTFSDREAVVAGGLMYYGADLADSYRRIATYVDRILRGTKPADLPVEQPKKLEFVINLKTAEQIGLTIPPNVLARADRVIR
jgi:putative ABC transport system substrate-binding protein